MIVDAFAGPGGWDQGARIAGYRGPLVGIEWDMDACRTAVAAGHARIRADVATFPLGRLVGKVDGLIASPPCPTWSTAGAGAGKVDLPNVLRLIADFAAGREPGTYEWADARSALTAQPMRWVQALRPRWVALEQVPPVLPVWQHVADRLRGLGYRVWTGVLGAEEYGVPQTRKRAVLVASLDGPVGPPAPTHQAYRAGRAAQAEPDLFGDPLPPPVSMAEALGWDDAGERRMWPAGLTGSWQYSRSADAPSPTIKGSGSGGQYWSVRTGNNSRAGGGTTVDYERAVEAPPPTLTGNVSRWALLNGPQANATARRLEEPAGTIYSQRTGNLTWVHDRPDTTVCGDPRIGRPGHKDRDKGEAQFAEDPVRVSVQEAGVLQSFPPDYPWHGTSSKQFLQCGNAVPPLLAKAILAPLISASAKEAAA